MLDTIGKKSPAIYVKLKQSQMRELDILRDVRGGHDRSAIIREAVQYFLDLPENKKLILKTEK